MQSVRALVMSRQAVMGLRGQLAEAEADDAKKYAAALSDGWSEAELRKVGLGTAEPTRRTRTVPRRPRQTESSDGDNSAPATDSNGDREAQSGG
jgi:hypothetical protein